MAIIGPREHGTREGTEISVTPEIQKALEEAATAEQVKGIMHDAAVAQGVAAANLDGELVPTGLAANPPKKYGTYITGPDKVRRYVEADNPEALQKAITEALQTTGAGATNQNQHRDPATGRFVEQKTQQQQTKTQADIALDAHFANYLADNGIDIQVLRDATAQKAADQQYVADWKTATEEFLKDPTNDWPGGQKNLETLGRIIEANRLEDQPSVETIRQVYGFMKENGLLEEQQAERDAAIEQATSRESLNEAIGYGRGRNHAESGGFFGR